jgi:hypothetical protein
VPLISIWLTTQKLRVAPDQDAREKGRSFDRSEINQQEFYMPCVSRMQCDATAARLMIEKACLGWIERVTGLGLGSLGTSEE